MPVIAVPAGTVALENRLLVIVPQIMPNSTTNWQPVFDNGIIAADVKVTFNGRAFAGRDNMQVSHSLSLEHPIKVLYIHFLLELQALWAQLNQNIVERIEAYVYEPTGTVAFALDEEGYV